MSTGPTGSTGTTGTTGTRVRVAVPGGVTTASSGVLAADRRLPLIDPLASLVPEGGLVRGRLVAVSGPGAYSLALALLVAPTQAGSWAAFVGLCDVGWAAAAELGVALERTVVVALPAAGRVSWAEVVAAVADGIDLVLVPASARLTEREARRVQQRLTSRGGVLIVVGGHGPFVPDLVLRSGSPRWSGLDGDGAGRLCRRSVQVAIEGRRCGGRDRRADLVLPAEQGGIEVPVRPLVPVG